MRYRAVTAINKDNIIYKKGALISLTEEEAASMPWAVELVNPDDIKKGRVRIDELTGEELEVGKRKKRKKKEPEDA